jgi:hypothetical protein
MILELTDEEGGFALLVESGIRLRPFKPANRPEHCILIYPSNHRVFVNETYSEVLQQIRSKAWQPKS